MRYIAKERPLSNYQNYDFSFEMVDTSFEEMEISEYLTQKKTVLSRSVRASMEDGLLSKIKAFFGKIIGFFTGIFKKIFGFSKMAKEGAKNLDGKVDIANLKPDTWMETRFHATKLKFVNNNKVSIDEVKEDFNKASDLLEDYRAFLGLAAIDSTKQVKEGKSNLIKYDTDALTKQKGFDVTIVPMENAKIIMPKVTFAKTEDVAIQLYAQKKDFKTVAKALQDMANGLGDIEKKIDLSLKSLKNNEKLALEYLGQQGGGNGEAKSLYATRMMAISKEYQHLTGLGQTLVSGILFLVNHYNGLIKG